MKKLLLLALASMPLLAVAQSVSTPDLRLNYIGWSSGAYLISVEVLVPGCTAEVRINYNGRNQDTVLQVSGTQNISLPGAFMSKPIRIKSSSSCASSNGWLEILPVLTPTVLPIKLLSFDIKRISGTITLTWRTAEESNVSRLLIERSANAVDWATIKAVLPTGSGSLYTVQDLFPVPGRNFYRIRTVDNDSRNTYSSIRSIESDVRETDYQVIDLWGRTIASGKEAITRSLQAGTYFLKCTSGTSTWTETLIIR